MKISTFKFQISHLSLILFHLIFLVIVITNFHSGLYFLGWDSLSPEFNFALNFRRALSATWQENYGLGTIGGHGFAATLPHTLLTYLFSTVFPQWAIRTVFTLFCLYAGGLGMFQLSKVVLEKTFTQHFSKLRLQTSHLSWIALFSSLFYILNLGTAQMFTIQLETFIGHFAALPWLFWVLLKVLSDYSSSEEQSDESRRNNDMQSSRLRSNSKVWLLFIAINFFASLQGFIPSLFLAYLIALLAFLGSYTLISGFAVQTLKKSFLILLLTFMTNAYWLMPLIYYQTGQNALFLDSYNNLTSTPHFIDINTKYGNFTNVALLRGYLFDSYQLGGYVLEPFITHLSQTLPIVIGYVIFGIGVIGVGLSLFKRSSALLLGFSLVYLFFFASLATDTPPFSLIIDLLRTISPTYEQAFRTAFTKFSIGLSFSYSLFLGIGLCYLLLFAKKLHHTKTLILLGILFTASLIYYGFPIIQGKLLYENLFVRLPTQYTDVMKYFKTQPDGRIADFPQECAEGWYAYKWGYFGSGFYWYGIKQPFLSRTFDVWSNNNENYYWELTQAIKNENFQTVEHVLEKYDTRWVLYDPNAYYCRNQYGTLTQEKFIEYLRTDDSYRFVREFTGDNADPLLLFEKTNPVSERYVSLADSLPVVLPSYNWNDMDTVYQSIGTYTSNGTPDIFTPFRTLFTKRNATEAEFETNITSNMLTFTQTIPDNLKGFTFSLQSLLRNETTFPVQITFENRDTTTDIVLSVLFPKLSLDGTRLYENQVRAIIGSIPSSESIRSIEVNGAQAPSDYNNTIYYSAIFPEISNTIVVTNTQNQEISTITIPNTLIEAALNTLPNEITLPPYQNGVLEVEVPKIADQAIYSIEQIQNRNIVPKACNELTESNRNIYEIGTKEDGQFIRMESLLSTQCLTYTLEDVLSSEGYLLSIKSNHVRGNALRLTVTNQNRAVILDQYLPKSQDDKTTNLILSPNNQFGIGYTLQFTNSSESYSQTVNDLYGVDIWHIPYRFLTKLTFTNPGSDVTRATLTTPQRVSHDTETHYLVETGDTQADTLILWQGYNDGWKAYRIKNLPAGRQGQDSGFMNDVSEKFPFLFGEELTDHIKINNWANGWNVGSSDQESDISNQKIVVTFLPQQMQNAGFVLLIGSFVGVLLVGVIKRFR